MWTLDYLEDIAADLAVFFRVDDPMELPGPLYFSRAERLPAYSGALAARLERQRDRERPAEQQMFDHSADAPQEAQEAAPAALLTTKYPGMFDTGRG